MPYKVRIICYIIASYARAVMVHNGPPVHRLYYINNLWSCDNDRGAKQGGGLGGLNPPPPWILDGGGVEHLSTPPDFEKKIFSGGWLPLNWSNYIVNVFLST